MNIAATLSVFRLVREPSLCLPHATVSTFAQLPVPLSKAFANHHQDPEKPPEVAIKAVVLDKDNCIARPHEDAVYPPYQEKFEELKRAYSPRHLLIVSNSSGTTSEDPDGKLAAALEQATGVKVLRHNVKKPGCREEVLQYFRNEGVTSPAQIAVVGDRLFTDVMMANLMGSRAIWVRDGVVPDKSILITIERRVAGFLLRRGYTAPEPRSYFED